MAQPGPNGVDVHAGPEKMGRRGVTN
jgi:hypothetical protein